MNQRDNYHAMLNRRDPLRLPFDVPMVEPVRRRLADHYGDDDLATRFDLTFEFHGPNYGVPAKAWEEAYRGLGLELPEPRRVGPMGTVHRVPQAADMGDSVHMAEMWPMLTECEDVAVLESLPFPRVGDPGHFAHLERGVAATHARGRVAVGLCACTIFERTWYVRGMDRVFMDLFEDHPVTRWLFDYTTASSCHAMQAYCEAGVDQIHLGDDVASQIGLMMSKDMWRTHLRPRMQRVVDTIREHQRGHVWVSYHSDGDLTDLIDDLIELGIDVINPVQPECMDVEAVAERFGDRVGLYGGIGTQTTMPFGSPDDVRASVERLAAIARRGVPMIAAPTHVLEPDVPTENIEALVEAIHATDLRAAAV